MMGPPLTITADATRVSMAESIRRLVTSVPLFLLTSHALAGLVEELGSWGTAMEFVRGLAEANNRPVAINVPTGPDASSTVFIGPASWSEGRLTGWVAGHRETLERQFGEVERIGPFLPAPKVTPRQRRRRRRT
jgi:hypothetical protein